MLDEHGYPDDASLDQIEKFDLIHGDLDEFLKLVHDNWKWADSHNPGVRPGFRRTQRGLTLITGGWSGNEDVLESIGKNFLFHGMYWHCSRRGGYHHFTNLPRRKKGVKE